MITTRTSGLRRTGLLIVALLTAAVVAAPAFGATESGAPPQSAIDNASATWAAKAKLLDAYGHPMIAQLPPLSAIDNASATWAAKAKLLDAYGHAVPVPTVAPVTSSAGFDWGDFGIGAGAAFGLALLAVGLASATHYGRRHHTRPHATV